MNKVTIVMREMTPVSIFSPVARVLSAVVVSVCAGIVVPALLNAVPVASAASAGMAALPDFSDLVEKVGPAVVNIRTTSVAGAADAEGDGQDEQMQEFFRRFFGVPMPAPGPHQQPAPGQKGKKNQKVPQDSDEQIPHGIGSGFIISQDGYVMTNAHVVDGADEVYVKLTDNREFKAKVIGLDARTDVAVLKIDGVGLPEVTIGISARARVGEWVIAIGSPFDLENTVTAGIISAKARETGDFLPLIQTDVAVNPGNSGGPLINMRGEVVGINSQIYSKSGGFMGISFAVPIDEAMVTAAQLKSAGHVTRGRLGVYLGEVSKELAVTLGLPSAKGSFVGRIEVGGPAEAAGLEGGDIILKYNNVLVDKSADLRRMVASGKPGSTINLLIWHKGVTKLITVTLAEVELDKQAKNDVPASAGDVAETNAFGIDVSDMTESQKKELHIASGILITGVDSATVRPGLHDGDIILTLNNMDIKDVAQFSALAAKTDIRKTIVLLVRRGEDAQFISLRPSIRP